MDSVYFDNVRMKREINLRRKMKKNSDENEGGKNNRKKNEE